MKVHVENYQILANVTFEATGITVISGKTSNGKSSLYRAIRSACFGRRGDDFIRIGASSVVVALDFDGEAYAWRKDADNIDFYQGAKRFTKTGGQPPDEYLDALKIKEIELGKFKVAPNFSGQFDSLFLVGLSPVDAASALSSLFSGEKFPQLLKQVSKFIKDTKKEVTFLDGSLATLEAQLNDLTSKAYSFEALTPVFALKPQIDAIVEHCSGLNTLLEDGLRAKDNVRLGIVDTLVKAKELEVLASLDTALVARYLDGAAVWSHWTENRVSSAQAQEGHYRAQVAVKMLETVDSAFPATRDAVYTCLSAWEREVLNVRLRGIDLVEYTKSLALLPPDEELVNKARVAHDLIDGWKNALTKHDGQKRLVAGIPHELAQLEAEIASTSALLTECPVCTSKLTELTRDALLRNES